VTRFIQGKLLYSHPPPDVDPEEFNDFDSRETAKQVQSVQQTGTQLQQNGVAPSKVDAEFFTRVSLETQ